MRLLGAGFSAEAGLPLISNFKNKMLEAREWLEKKGWTEEGNSIAKVIQFRREASKACQRLRFSPDNIEHLFSLAAASDTKIIDDIRRSIAATLEYSLHGSLIHQRNFTMHLPNRDHRGESDRTLKLRGSFYGAFARLFAGEGMMNGETRNTIITLNYDTLLETGFKESSLLCRYGHDPDDDAKVTILKLHGSINWTSDEVMPSYADVRHAKALPLLVPPTWNKFFDNPKLIGAWEGAVKAIETADRIILIGFSIPEADYHFRYLLGAGFMENITLKNIHVLDPNIEKIKLSLDRIFTDDQILETSTHQTNVRDLLLLKIDLLREIGLADGYYSIRETN